MNEYPCFPYKNKSFGYFGRLQMLPRIIQQDIVPKETTELHNRTVPIGIGTQFYVWFSILTNEFIIQRPKSKHLANIPNSLLKRGD